MLDAQGYLAIPQRPGLGIDLDPDKLARYTRNPGAAVQRLKRFSSWEMT